MKNIQVATIGLPPLLSEIVSRTIREQQDMELLTLSSTGIAEINDGGDSIDVVITSIGDDDMRECVNYLFRHPRTAIINISNSARSGDLLKLEMTRMDLDEVSPQQLLQVIRECSPKQTVT